MDIAASTIAAATPKPAFESLDGALRRLSSADVRATASEPAIETPARFPRKGQALDIRV